MSRRKAFKLRISDSFGKGQSTCVPLGTNPSPYTLLDNITQIELGAVEVSDSSLTSELDFSRLVAGIHESIHTKVFFFSTSGASDFHVSVRK